MLGLLTEELANVSVWLRTGVQGGSLAKRADEVVGLHFGTHKTKAHAHRNVWSNSLGDWVVDASASSGMEMFAATATMQAPLVVTSSLLQRQ
jgi:hypothetical protein